MRRRRGLTDTERLAAQRLAEARGLFVGVAQASRARDCQAAGVAFTAAADKVESACAVLRPGARKGVLDKACASAKRRQAAVLAAAEKRCRWTR